MSFRPPSSVLSRTFVRTGSERFETARLTTDRPRARFSCMTESFTSGLTPSDGAGLGRVGPDRGRATGRAVVRGYLLSIFSSPSSPSSWCGRRGRPRRGVRPPARWTIAGPTVDGAAASRWSARWTDGGRVRPAAARRPGTTPESSTRRGRSSRGHRAGTVHNGTVLSTGFGPVFHTKAPEEPVQRAARPREGSPRLAAPRAAGPQSA